MGDKPTSKSVTVFDVAREAGVSKSTVSLVLTQSDKVSDKAKLKVEKAIEKTGYVYNRDAASLRSRRSNLVAIVINDLTNPYSAQLAVGLEAQIRKMGMFSMLVNSAESVETQTQLVKNLKEYNVAAFIICPAPGTTSDWMNKLVDQGFPVVNIMREISGAKVATVLPDNFTGTKLATEHLLAKGYKKLAFIGGLESISDYHQRLSGFTEAMVLADKSVAKKLCIQSETNRNGGRNAMLEVLDVEPDIEAIVCFNDVIAYGAVEQMRASGKIPGKDIAVVGFDDLEDSKLMSPSLSTVHVDANKIGIAVCQILSNIKDGNRNKILVGVDLIERETS
ncbi:LacI family DNA-binding transcriptional regulator [Pseudoalteromonas denitrificans]|uniref:Transcriptional regulator, LacI family n=1 Tax=Pseudoalteromonas denitrificans DSM 6059 TaxID=1123010 RepID=A0A1I1RIF0_9GAMM|nr:LacI family DNA-binding transcriptional regulator [Pseudoalteromonas denitrificans]SFD34094.1 transcriptional regulator, LacI family [Pseudoalteromonas denitrificans DSM 6059]